MRVWQRRQRLLHLRDRFARGLAYARYLNDNFGAQHQTVIVRACGHSARCMFTAEAALPILFPKE